MPIAILICVMIAGYSPQVAALCGIVSTIVVSWFRPETRMGSGQIWQALVNAGKNCVFVAALAGCVGVLIGVLSLTKVAMAMRPMGDENALAGELDEHVGKADDDAGYGSASAPQIKARPPKSLSRQLNERA